MYAVHFHPLTPSRLLYLVYAYVHTTPSCVGTISCTLYIYHHYILSHFTPPASRPHTAQTWALRCTSYSWADRVNPISRPREPRFLAVLGRPVKLHWPTHFRVISRILLYLVLYTLHQPQYLVDSNRAMNLCILHKYLNHNILCYKDTIPTIYSCATRSARFAVSRALTAHPTKDRCCALACHVARISQSDGLFCTVRLNAPSSQRFFYFLCSMHKNRLKNNRYFV